MKPENKNLLHLHLIVLIYGFTAILGRLITLPATELVWYRMLIAFIALGVALYWNRRIAVISFKDVLTLLGVGGIVAIHWITFFHAIKISTVSVALGCLASTTLFTSFLEPAFFKRKVSKLEVFTGIIIIIGLYAIFRFETRYVNGILVALTSAFLAALFTVINKKLIAKHAPLTISFYEMAGGLLSISLILWLSGTLKGNFPIPTTEDWIYLIILGGICTAYAYLASVYVMKSLSAYTVVLAINLEPVYGILMAFFIFGESERMSTGFYLGTAIILAAVFLFPVIRKKYPALQAQKV
ncbi:DMT family transporter [Alkalitalea saponilacus]|uniref:EamA domain-containing membrane protein RarD n=1 Tax=Alkalitalea saponilacus TaxID=889453 RepID=A0A1T5HBK9_9BACT|nr:DMT family transporter [Alkalitalea saponilacus]ASB50767.1 EamA family transporter [Alkalitalea saponilacus]SKC18073.1 EamA domain-containing membrane protein RarD [Alkalitalea saponilacus]